MASSSPMGRAKALTLDYPQSLGVFADYQRAQRAVDYLSDAEFAVQNCMIVGTDLKQVERVTGRLTWSRAAIAGAASGAWIGVFVGLLISLFGGGNLATVVAGVLIGVAFGITFGLAGYAATGGHRDFTSVTQVVATRYEVLVEHRLLEQAQTLLAAMPDGAQTL
jgi:hypothetical protein